MTTDDELLRAWEAEERPQPEGWDFSSLDDRMTEDSEPWDLPAVWRTALSTASRALDMGTGGGEFLARFADVLPQRVAATEGWLPNLRAARAGLAPYDVGVVGADPEEDGSRLPFADGSFDVVLNRHEAYDPTEVWRVLSPSGSFVTQQVGGDEFGEIRRAFDLPVNAPDVSYERCRAGLVDAGFEVVDGAETVGHYIFQDVAALIAYVQLVPWDAPDDFSVRRYADALLGLHASGPADGRPLLATRKRFWLRARRTAV